MIEKTNIISKVQQRILESAPIHKLTQLLLDEIKIIKITNELRFLLEKCHKIRYLSLQQCGLESLDNLPLFPKLQKIELCHNHLRDADITFLQEFKSLKEINLQNNNISEMETIEFLKVFPELVSLNLRQNPIAKHIQYRTQVFSNLKNLQYLDNIDKTGNQLVSDVDEEQDQDSLEDSQNQNDSEQSHESQELDVVRKQTKL